MKDFVCNFCMSVWSVIGPEPTRCPHCKSEDIQQQEETRP